MRSITLLLLSVIMFCAPAFSQDWAKAKLDKSPRHREWVTIKNGNRSINTFVVYPQVKEKAKTVLVIHEIFGLTDWVRQVADEFAEAGYIAIAPDLLSGMAPKGGGTAEFGSDDNAIKAIRGLPPNQITADLKAAMKYAKSLPSANGTIAVAGFCWGGAQAFRFATNNDQVAAALVFYGTPPDSEKDMARIKAPIYGFYGENDARVTSTVDKTTQTMKNLKKQYFPIVYKDAGHGFMRTGEGPGATAADTKARSEAWTAVKKALGN
jgi:carboxymethylenebutenolidase